MMYSMTGYGVESLKIHDILYQIEIKTLNSKGFDFFYKCPSLFRNLEIGIKNQVQKKLDHGKIELNIQSKETKKSFLNIEENLFIQQYDFLFQLSQKVNSSTDVFPLAVEKYSSMTEVDEISEADVHTITQAIENALTNVVEFRKIEGAVIERDIISWLECIEKRKNEIAQIEPNRINDRKSKLITGIQDLIQSNEIDYNRLSQEMVYYIEKLDISEELSRLTQHISLFRNTMTQTGSMGKKLGFVCQELGREINTIGSKANDAEIQHLVVDMKDQLEKIKEQINNIL